MPTPKKRAKQSPETIAKRAMANTGKKRTPETCQKISEALKGKSPSPEARAKTAEARRGTKASDETQAKMSVSQKARNVAAGGDALSPEARAKVTEANRGRVVSEETRARLSTGSMGKTAWNKDKVMWSEEERAKMSEDRKGRGHTPETRARMSATRKGKPIAHLAGRPAHNKGVPMSDEQKAKLSAAKKGKPRSPEASAKAAESNRGRKRSEEFCAQLGARQKGHIKSPETLQKLSQAAKGRIPPIVGQHHTPEARAKMSERVTAYWAGLSEEEKTERLKKLQASNQDIIVSKIEDFYAQSLDVQGIVYERQKKIGWYRVDFYIPSEQRIIEVQGCYWHSCPECGKADKHPETAIADEKRFAYLRRKGYTVDVVWEHEFPYHLRH